MSDDDSIPMPRDQHGWAKDFVDRGAWVMHLPSRTIGKVARFYDGEGQLYVSPTNSAPVKAPVIEMERGNSFVAEAGAFIELNEREQDFFNRASAVVQKLISDFAMLSTATQVPPKTAMMLLSTILRTQADELDRARTRPSRG